MQYAAPQPHLHPSSTGVVRLAPGRWPLAGRTVAGTNHNAVSTSAAPSIATPASCQAM